MTMINHIFSSSAAAHDVELEVAPAPVPFASVDNFSAYTDKYATDTVSLFTPAPS